MEVESSLVSMKTILLVLNYVLVVWYCFMVALSLFGQYIGYVKSKTTKPKSVNFFVIYALRQSRYRHKPEAKSSKLPFAEAEGVSIIRPLKGVDLELEANLRSSFIQNYPKFEIIFSVASPEDPAIAIVNSLMQEFHNVDSRLIIGK